MTFLLDTNTCIVAMNDIVGPARARVREEGRKRRDMFVSAVSVLELWYGAHKSERTEANLKKMTTFLELLARAPFEIADAEAAGAVRATLERHGQPIGAYDVMIAGHALNRGWTLVTDNEREFRRIDGLKVENWVR